MKFGVLIVDDEMPARKLIRRLLEAHSDFEIVGEAASSTEAHSLIREFRPDLILLDVRMPKGDGLQLLEDLEHRPGVIFVTGHEEHACAAFDFEALDYLMKPVSVTRLGMALDRFRLLKAIPAGEAEDRLILEVDGTLRSLSKDEVLYVKAHGNHSEFYLKDGRVLITYQSLGDWENQLMADGFVRADRSHLLNVKNIDDVRTLNRDLGSLKFKSAGSYLELGRTATSRIRDFLKSSRG